VVTELGAPVIDYRITLAPRGPTVAAGSTGSILRIHDPGGRFAFSRLTSGSHELQVSTVDGQTGGHPSS
jgi:hypothetical protein